MESKTLGSTFFVGGIGIQECSRIPEGVPDEVAGPIMCSASTMHRALKDAQLKPGDFVVFPGGGGGVGIQGVQLAK